MNLPAAKLSLTPEEYLEGELHSEVRHEYLNGVVHAMSGASEEHNVIAGNCFAALHAHLRGSPCRAYVSDMKVRVRALRDDRFYYPDVQVTCASGDRERYYKERPKLVVEVLSPSTERADRAEKFAAYRRLESLEEYVLIAQDARRVEIYRRATGWEMELIEVDGECRLDSVDIVLSLDQLYEDVTIPASNRPAWIDAAARSPDTES